MGCALELSKFTPGALEPLGCALEAANLMGPMECALESSKLFVGALVPIGDVPWNFQNSLPLALAGSSCGWL